MTTQVGWSGRDAAIFKKNQRGCTDPYKDNSDAKEYKLDTNNYLSKFIGSNSSSMDVHLPFFHCV